MNRILQSTGNLYLRDSFVQRAPGYLFICVAFRVSHGTRINTTLLVKRRLDSKLLDQIRIRSDVNTLVMIAVIKDNILAKILRLPTKRSNSQNVSNHDSLTKFCLK